MTIKKLEKKDYQRYEDFLLGFEECLFYYSIKYKLFLETVLNIDSNYLLVTDDEQNILAVLPIMYKEGKYGLVINSLPYYGSNGGIISKSIGAYNFLLSFYYNLSNKSASSTYINSPFCNKSDIKYDIMEKRISQWTYLNFKDNIEERLLLSFDGRTRTSIRKAIKGDIQITIDNNQIEFLTNTHHANMNSIGGKAKTRKFFELIDKYFDKGTDYNIYIATINNKKIAALLLFYFNNTVEYFTPVVLKDYRSFQPLPLLIYKSMIDATKKGYKYWNWGGTWKTQQGVYKFKKQFGAVDKEYKYFITINNQDIYKATQEELIKEYDDFYVIPFNMLKGKE